MRGFVTLLYVLGCVILGGCGTIGEPLYPALKIPSRVTDLTAVERGDRIDINFTIPPLTTEGLALKEIGEVELRVGPVSGTTFNVNNWANAANRVDLRPPEHPGLLHAESPAQGFVGKDVVVAVRVANAKGRNSEWSNFVTVSVEQPLAKPADLKASAIPEGVALTWNAPSGIQFRLFRQADQEQKPSPIGTAAEPKYLDTTAEYGKTYQYYVQSVHDKTESDVTEPVSVTPKDIFPPHIPTGLTASAGLGSVELAWERNTEPDFKEYRVYRSEAQGPFAQIADGLEAPSYSDHNIESGKHYRYRVAALDQAGNASEPCDPVEAIAP
jgi:predicted phage tail protein